MANLIENLQKQLPEGFELEEDRESGQPNGSGEIEPNWYREWFDEKNTTHTRRVITIKGPWVPKEA